MLSINNINDKPKMMEYYRTSDMLNLLYFFPQLSPIKDLTIVESKEDYLNNKKLLDSFNQNRVDTLKGRIPILGIENSGKNDSFYNTLIKVKEKDPLGVLVLFNIVSESTERYEEIISEAEEKLSVNLNNVDTELEENREKIKILTENNEALSLKVDALSKNIENKNKEIKELKKDNRHLEKLADYFKDLFDRLVNFIKHKMFDKDKEREDYWEFLKDLYEHGIFSDKTITDIKDDYDWNKKK